MEGTNKESHTGSDVAQQKVRAPRRGTLAAGATSELRGQTTYLYERKMPEKNHESSVSQITAATCEVVPCPCDKCDEDPMEQYSRIWRSLRKLKPPDPILHSLFKIIDSWIADKDNHRNEANELETMISIGKVTEISNEGALQEFLEKYSLRSVGTRENDNGGEDTGRPRICEVKEANGNTESRNCTVGMEVEPVQESSFCLNEDSEYLGDIICLRESDDVDSTPADIVEHAVEGELEKLDFMNEIPLEFNLVSAVSNMTFLTDETFEAKLEPHDSLEIKPLTVGKQDSKSSAQDGVHSFFDSDPVKMLLELEPEARYEISESVRTVEGNSGTSALPEISESHKKLGKKKKNKMFEPQNRTTQKHTTQDRTTYTVSCHIRGNIYRGYSYFKEFAISSAARAALEYIYGYIFPTIAGVEELVAKEGCDKVAELLNVCNLKSAVFGAIVMTTAEENQEPSDIKVISAASGTKCVFQKNWSDIGETINDSHAEIQTVKGVRKFLIKQLEVSNDSLAASVLEKYLEGDEYRNRVKPHVEFHLLISTTPCGSSRVSSAENNDGRLRMKVQDRGGTHPVELAYSALSLVEKRLTMSCSDKLLKCNVLGIQGAELSLVMDPVYLSSVLVSDKYDKECLSAALFGRANDIDGLPKGFQKKEPFISTFSIPANIKIPEKPPLSGFCWIIDGDIDVIKQAEGKLIDGRVSNFSKKVMSESIRKLLRSNYIDSASAANLLANGDLKAAALRYEKAKTLLYELLKEKSYGKWV